MKIVHEKAKCIGCGSCVAVCPKFFEMDEEGKAHLKGSEVDPNTETEELETDNPGCTREAAEVCPVQIIKIEK